MPLIPALDGHNDVLSAILAAEQRGNARPFFTRTTEGHLDLPRAREGGFAGGLFSVYVGPDPTAPPPAGPLLATLEDGEEVRLPRPLSATFAQRVSLAEMGILFRLERQSAGALKIVRDADELDACLASGTLAAVMHFEGAEAIDPRLDALPVFHAAGLRSLGLVWSRPNDFGEGVPFLVGHSPDTGPGLTVAGKALVQACNELRILVDVSHLNEQGFWDVARLSQKPLVATHSNAHALTPSPRNLTDRQLDAIRDSGGLVGVNFYVAFLRPDGRRDPDTSISAIVDHVRYLVERLGVQHVAFGADMDGSTIPTAVGDVAGLPGVMDALRAAGFDEPALHQLGHQNWQRVLRATWSA